LLFALSPSFPHYPSLLHLSFPLSYFISLRFLSSLAFFITFTLYAVSEHRIKCHPPNRKVLPVVAYFSFVWSAQF
jgi:hypothetical protein